MRNVEVEGRSEIWVYDGRSSARRLRSSDSFFLVIAPECVETHHIAVYRRKCEL